MSDYNFDGYKNDALTRPRDKAWDNWKSWKDSVVGEKVQGYVADAFYRPEEKNPQTGEVEFREQRGITLRLSDGSFMNVGVKYLDFVLVATDHLRIGDPLTIELDKILQPKSKARKGAKVFAYYGKNLPENAGNPTVKELTDADRSQGGSKDPIAGASGRDEEGEDGNDVDLEAAAAEFEASTPAVEPAPTQE